MSAEIDLSRIRFRMLSYLDFIEFKRAAIESVSSNDPYLIYGRIFKEAPVIEYLEIYFAMLKNRTVDHFGLFDGKTLLGHLSYSYGWSQLGTELIGWIRRGYQNQKLGEFGLEVGCKTAFNHKKFNYVELKIDSKNIPSQKVAEKLGFQPLIKIKYSFNSADSYIYYVKINPEISSLAKSLGVRDIDLMNSPATDTDMRNYLENENVFDWFKWPFPLYNEEARPVNERIIQGYLGCINLEKIDKSNT